MVEINLGRVVGANGINGKDGINGTNGTDGVSPTIDVKTNTETQYILTIEDAEGVFDTPNLKGANGEDGLTVSVRANNTTYTQQGGLVTIPLNAVNFNIEYEDGTTATLKVGVFD